MKKLNKLFAILVAMAMVMALAVTSAFAVDPKEGDPAPAEDFAVTKLLKVPTGTAIPANTSIDVVFDNTKYNSVTDGATYDKTINLKLTEANFKVKDTTTKEGTTYYYFSTENMLAALGLTDAPVGVYEYSIKEENFLVGGVAYNSYTGGTATIEEDGPYTLTVAKTKDGYSITASDGTKKVPVKKFIENDNASVTENGLKLINAYREESGSNDYASSKIKVTKDVTNDGGLYAGDGFAMTATVILPDINGVEVEAYIKRANAAEGATDEPVTLTNGSANISLAEGDYFYVTKAPVGTLVSVSETDARAALVTDTESDVMYTKSGEFEDYAITKTAETKTITNEYRTTSTEGVLTTNLPYIVLALVAIGGMVAYVVVRRRNADEA